MYTLQCLTLSKLLWLVILCGSISSPLSWFLSMFDFEKIALARDIKWFNLVSIILIPTRNACHEIYPRTVFRIFAWCSTKTFIGSFCSSCEIIELNFSIFCNYWRQNSEEKPKFEIKYIKELLWMTLVQLLSWTYSDCAAWLNHQISYFDSKVIVVTLPMARKCNIQTLNNTFSSFHLFFSINLMRAYEWIYLFL